MANVIELPAVADDDEAHLLWSLTETPPPEVTLHPFVGFRMDAPGAYRHEYREWDWSAGRPALSTTLEPSAARGRRRRDRR